MKVQFLGSGSAFVLGKENYQSNILIENDGKYLLYDAGTTLPDSLNAVNLKPQDLDTIYISHLHADHAGGIEYIAFKTYFEQFPFGVNKINLIGYHRILNEGWENTWKGGLQSIQGKVNTLETYFDTKYLKDNDTFDFYGVTMKPVQTIHVVDNRQHVPSYGMMFDTPNGNTVFISGDTQFAPNQMLTYFEQSDVIFHDCEFAEYPNSVHAQFHQLCTLDEDIKSRMYLYHYSLGTKTYEELNDEVLKNGFAGLVKRGHTFNI